jgi:hypothetical protein
LHIDDQERITRLVVICVQKLLHLGDSVQPSIMKKLGLKRSDSCLAGLVEKSVIKLGIDFPFCRLMVC